MDSIRTTLRYDADLGAAMAQVKALTGQVGALNLAFNSLDKNAVGVRNTLANTFAANLSSMGGFRTEMVNLTGQTEKFGRALAANKLSMREYFAEAYRGYTRQSSMMRQLAREQVKFQEAIAIPMGRNAAGQMQGLMAVPTQVDFKNASTRMKLLSQEFNIFNQLVRNGADELINMGKNTQWTGRQLTVGLTMPVVLFGATFAKVFMDIDKQMTRFAKVYGEDVIGTSARATEDMKKQVMELAETISSQFGVAASETVGLAADIAATGKEGQDLLDTVAQTNKLAVLGEVDRQEAMKATLAIQSAFKQNTDELAESINFLNAVENQTSTTLNDLVEAIPKAGPVVKGLGGSIKDLSVLMVAMKEGGIPAAEAANAIKSGLASLINPTKKASEVAKQFGVDLVGIVEANKGQLMPTIMAVQTALNGLDAFSRSKIIEEIFGKYQFARISALFNNLGKAGSQTQQAMELAGASTTELAGIANQELKAYTESTTVRFQRMVETVKNQLVPMGASLLEMLTPALDKLSGIIEVIRNAVGNLPDFLKEPLKIIGAFALFAGPILMLVGLFKNLIGNAIKFSMSIVGLGAKIAGLDVRKFELLDAETAAATMQIDNMSTSFVEQKVALSNLNVELGKYITQLRTVATQNPNLLVRAPASPPLIRRSDGSRGPEIVPGGYGGGDKIPALLEPGEFVMNKEAASRFGSILNAMNRGTIQKFQEGGLARSHVEEVLVDGKKQFGGVISIENQDYNQILNSHKDLFPGRKQPVTMADFYASLAAARAYAQNNQVTPSFAAGLAAMEHDARIINNDENTFRRMLAERMALGTLSVLPSSVVTRTGLTVDQIFNAERDRFLGILTSNTDATSIRAALVESSSGTLRANGVTYAGEGRERSLSNIRGGGRRGEGETRYSLGLSGRLMPLYQKDENRRNVPSLSTVTRLANSAFAPFAPEYFRGPGQGQPVPPSMARPVGPGRRPLVGVMPGELLVPPRMFADNGAIVDENGRVRPLPPAHPESPLMQRLAARAGRTTSSISAPGTSQASQAQPDVERSRGSLMGGGMVGGMFGLSMAGSTMSMFMDSTSEATQALSKFSMGLMAVSSIMMMMPSRMPSNMLGLGTLGGRMSAAGASRAAAGATGLGTSALLRGGAALSMLGGPVGIAAGIGVTAAIAGFVMYKKAAEEARQRAISAFSDPVKTAEYFGKRVEDVTDKIKQNTLELQAGADSVSQIDESLREAIRQDYSSLIERLKYSAAEAGAKQLAIAFNKMVSSGLSADEARSAIQAIAEESGTAGGQAFGIAMRQSMLREMTAPELIASTRSLFDPSQQTALADSMREQQQQMRTEAGALMLAVAKEQATFRAGLEDPVSAIVNMAARTGNVPSWAEWLMSPNQQALNEKSKALEQLASDLEQLSDIDSSQLIGITEQLFSNFEKAPREAIKAFDDLAVAARESGGIAFDPGPVAEYLKELDDISGPMLARFIQNNEERAQAVMRAITAGLTPQEIQKALAEGGLDELNIRIGIQIDIQEAKNRVEEAAQAVKDLASETGTMTEALTKGQQRLSNLIQQRTKAVDRFEADAETMAEAFKIQQQAAEDEINALEKEQNQIEKSADSYIKSIENRRQADKFYADQRRSSLDALSALAEGDVFGFLTARNEMQANAADYAYEQEINRIEERKNLENEVLQARIDKRQEEMDLASRAHDAAMQAMEDEKQAFFTSQDEKIAKQKTANEEMSKMIDGIKNGEIEAIDAVKTYFSKAAAAKYEEAVKYQMKETYALLQQQILKGDITKEQAGIQLQQMMQALFPRVQSGAFNVSQTIEETLKYLQLTPFQSQIQRSIESNIGDAAATAAGDPPVFRAAGGYISGPGTSTSDSIPALLSDGEYVIRASSVEKYGPEFFDQLNAAKFALGGMVEGYGEQQSRRASARFVGRTPLGGRRGGTGRGTGTDQTSMAGQGTDGFLAVEFAKQQLGEAYSLSPNNINSWGCSSLTATSWNQGVPNGSKKYGMVSYSATQIANSRQTAVRSSGEPGDGSAPPIPYSTMRIGDIVYFKNTGLAPSGQHVGLYAGAGRMIHAGNPVGYSDLSSDWNRRYFSSAGTPIAKFAKGGMVGRAFGAGGLAKRNMGYNLGGMVDARTVNSSNPMYNITINADGIKDPAIVAEMVVRKINTENSRRSHGRVI